MLCPWHLQANGRAHYNKTVRLNWDFGSPKLMSPPGELMLPTNWLIKLYTGSVFKTSPCSLKPTVFNLSSGLEQTWRSVVARLFSMNERLVNTAVNVYTVYVHTVYTALQTLLPNTGIERHKMYCIL